MATVKPLKVGVIGPKGQCGSCVVDELLSRGHHVTGISRNPPKTWKGSDRYKSITVDVYDVKAFSEVLSSNFDAIVCAFGPPLEDLSVVYRFTCEAHAKIKQAVLRSTHEGIFLIIGGAGSLHVKSGADFADGPDFPFPEWYAWPDAHLNYMRTRAKDHGGAGGFVRFIALFKWARNNIEYPGCIRTGRYEKYIDSIERPAYQGVDGGIYNEDMAVAIVDEVENPTTEYKHWTCTGPIDLKEW